MPTATPLPLSIPTETPTWFTSWLRRNKPGEKTAGSRAARLERCQGCKRNIIAGDNSHIGAHRVRVDPTPLTTRTELACLIAGRKTYLIDGTSTRLLIHERDRWQITGLPPGKNVIVPAHKCGARFPEPPTPKESTNDECPF